MIRVRIAKAAATVAAIVLVPLAVAWVVEHRGGPSEVFAGGTFAALLYLLRRHVLDAARLVGSTRRATAPYRRALYEWVLTFLPLAMLPLGLVLFAGEAFSRPGRFLTGVLVVALLVLIVALGRRELGETADELRWLWREVTGVRQRALRVAVAVALVAVAVFVWIAPSLGNLRDAHVDAGFIFEIAVILWLGAAACRLLGSAGTILRAITVVLIVVSLMGLLHDVGLLGGPFPELGWRVWLGIALAALVVSSLVEGWLRSHSPQRRDALAAPLYVNELLLGFGVLTAVGFGLAVVSAGAAITAAGIAATDVQEGKKVLADVQRQPTGHAPMTVADDELLARQYAPVLAYAREEGWSPDLVDTYVSRARLVELTPANDKVHEAGNAADPEVERRVRESGRSVTTEKLPQRCDQRRRRTCFVLTCEGGEGACTPASTYSGGDSVGGGVYARVIREDFDPDLFDVANPYLGELAALVEYWIFYPYDLWSTHVIVGRVDQQHEADWEAVVVGLGDTEPLFVAYSAHCSGHWYKWTAVPVTAAATAPSRWTAGLPFADDASATTHPIIAVATGSHANYPRVADRRAPDWGSCRDLPEQAVSTLSYTSNVRDVTGDYRRVYPERVQLLTGASPVAGFAGTWGWHDRTALMSARVLNFDAGSGPTSPKLKALWRDPLRTIFCGNWHPQHCSTKPA